MGTSICVREDCILRKAAGGCQSSTFTRGSCCRHLAEVVFEDCELPGGVRQTLLPWAVMGLCGYVVAFPCILFYLLHTRRVRIMEDQLLRAEGRGDSRLENPNCYHIRKMFHKCVSV